MSEPGARLQLSLDFFSFDGCQEHAGACLNPRVKPLWFYLKLQQSLA